MPAKPWFDAVVLPVEGVLLTESSYRALTYHSYHTAGAYLREHWGEPALSELMEELRLQARRDFAAGRAAMGIPPGVDEAARDGAIAYVQAALRESRVLAPLQRLEGRIWSEARERGGPTAEVHRDVAETFARWREAGVAIALFSTLDEPTMRMLLGAAGADVTAWFGPEAGATEDPTAWERVVSALAVRPAAVLALVERPDVATAAVNAGCRAAIVQRPGMMGTPGHGFRVEVTLRAF